MENIKYRIPKISNKLSTEDPSSDHQQDDPSSNHEDCKNNKRYQRVHKYSLPFGSYSQCLFNEEFLKGFGYHQKLTHQKLTHQKLTHQYSL